MADDFPSSDSAFHNYAETNAVLDQLVAQNPDIVSKHSIGKSVEGRDINGVRISSSAAMDALPTAVFIGCHHAREHLSVEVPLMLAQYLVNQYPSNPRVKEMVDTREIWVVPMLNPDGAEFDISTGSYKWWRKNRRQNSGSNYGVDLNRNYGKGFGGPGSSSSPSSDTYHGPSAFSEPETAAVRDFVRARNKTTVLLSFHTFSELVLWPWGHTDDVISDAKDRSVFETMGRKMATWNRYTPQKSSDLYVASGDTTDWAYDELKIFAFTFELSPSSLFGGGFYPGASAIQPTFAENLEPSLYLIENAADPYGVLNEEVTDPLGIL
ncbi:MAG: M14 family metallopeptidase [Bdellovibrionota bacterium]